MLRILLIAGLILPTPALAAETDAVDSAYRLCAVLDNTGLLSAPCDVSGWHSSVTAVMDTSSGEARKICAQIVQMMSQQNVLFPGGRWTMQIKSPYSGDNSIAFCKLP